MSLSNRGFNDLFEGSLNTPEQLTSEELERLPVFRAVGSYVGIECVICHERILSEEILRNLPGCTHTYHRHCIDDWLKQNPTCPLCRSNVRMSIL